MIRNGRPIRTERWRYSEWDEVKSGIELYDCDNEPGKLKKIAGDPAMAATLADLKGLLALERDK